MADYRHVYHVEGVTDLTAQLQAARRNEASGTFIVHEHAKGVICNNRCQAHWPGKPLPGAPAAKQEGRG